MGKMYGLFEVKKLTNELIVPVHKQEGVHETTTSVVLTEPVG